MTNERDAELIEEGRKAALAETIVGELIDQQMRVNVTQLIGMYRSGGIDHDMLVGKVAEIAALDNLMSLIENKQMRAVGATQREYGNGQTI